MTGRAPATSGSSGRRRPPTAAPSSSTGRSSATSTRPMSSASACTAPASTSPAIRPSPCRTSSSAPTAAIAWGATAGPLDVNDYVQLELNPENPHQYRHGGGWADMRLRQETIKVKGGDDVAADVWESDYGVVQRLRRRARPRLRLSPHLGRLRDPDADGLDPLDAGPELRPVARRGRRTWRPRSTGTTPTATATSATSRPATCRCARRRQDLRLPAKGDGSHGLAGHPPLRRRAEDAQPRAGLDRQLEQPLRQGHRSPPSRAAPGLGRPRGRDHVAHRGQGPLQPRGGLEHPAGDELRRRERALLRAAHPRRRRVRCRPTIRASRCSPPSRDVGHAARSATPTARRPRRRWRSCASGWT